MFPFNLELKIDSEPLPRSDLKASNVSVELKQWGAYQGGQWNEWKLREVDSVMEKKVL